MSLNYKKIFILLASLSLLLVPAIIAYATDYVLMEPSVVDKSSGATSPGLTTYLGWLYNSFFAFIAIASFFLIVWGGFEYVTSSIPNLKANGLTKINQALMGLAVALFSWLLLETISAGTFTNVNLKLNDVGGTSYSAGPAGSNLSSLAQSSSGSNLPNNPATNPSGSNLTEAEARQRFKDLGIPINAEPPQTQLAGMQKSTIDAVVSIKEDSLCDMMITGGTENTGVHSVSTYSHVNGYKVDIDDNNCLDNYFTGWKQIDSRIETIQGQRVTVPRYQNGNIIAADERNVPSRGSHWDLEVKPTVSGNAH